MDAEVIRAALPQALAGVDLPGLGPKHQGKVREWFRADSQRLLVTTDRLSAFDHILGLVPFKGQVLNQLAAFWFDATRDLVANHLVAVPDPNVTVAVDCQPYPVEVVVRGYITGVTTTSLWYHYERGARSLYGLELPDGLRKNDPLPTPLITPTTKAEQGHDQRLTTDEIVAQGLVPADAWRAIEAAALAVFARGQERARAAGMILVDTKYEFGHAPDGTLMLIDEVHTPDSSRFWLAASYPERLAAGQEPESFDKEFIRLWYAGQGYRGDGPPPPLPPELAVQAAQRYIAIYEALTGQPFAPAPYPASPRIARAVAEWAAAAGDRP
jgi:phosphoribosylaminoimidazole-succinocarboxamide synthase